MAKEAHRRWDCQETMGRCGQSANYQWCSIVCWRLGDSLTNISMGELLTEASQMETDGSEPPVFESDACLQQIPFSCDSFDAAIAAHIAGRQERLDLPSVQVSHASSIWDAEETCDAFSFRKVPPPNHDGGPSSLRAVSLGTCKLISSTPSTCFRGLIEELRETRTTENLVCEGSSTNNCDSNTNKPGDSTKDLDGLTDIYWPDSLGPLDLDIPSSRYQGQDLIFGDSISLSGLNRLIANSLDAFQNCSFFASDKVSTSEGRESAPVLDCKIGGEA
ncbi:hypothetical protein IFM89_034706 [Coptis chinensis]|uniref:Uncharacterized protein n=1 Tax=Coptis chinensis TaxID=261450 RepID=A0A835HAR4_9MAGN|nr:hypothetical protein IFM89_034706 [Coptis chinensis]